MNLKFEKIETIFEKLKSLRLIDLSTYFMVIENLDKLRRDSKVRSVRSIKDFCGYQASKLGISKDEVDILKQWLRDKKLALRNIIAHSGLVCPIIEETSSAEAKLKNIDQ